MKEVTTGYECGLVFEKFNDIQEKYYKEYSKFLSQLQIVELYDLERKQMDKMRRQGKKRPVQR